ncbi:hypothetical protein [Lysinibacillus agricola]|uniref:hypothetical protein n=1 Tax=Lysinibacillus agricola TaxID=2590012 RepID=UPI003C14C66E
MAILHITFSLSTQGAIKNVIRQNHLQRDESVLGIDDIFSPYKAGTFEIDGDTTDMYSYQVKYVGE